MRTESLNALLIDRELGELSPEAVELLDSWLAEHPAAAPELARVRRTLNIAGAAVRQFPELAGANSNILPLRASRFPFAHLAAAAAVLILLAVTVLLIFRAGQNPGQSFSATEPEAARVQTAAPAQPGGPWARYALVSSPDGGLTVVRQD